VLKLSDAILFIALVALLIVPHYLLRKASRKYGPGIVRRIVSRCFRPILTIYYRRKVIRQMEDERKAKGLPPLENPPAR
jgi:hypothetical protein